VPEPDYEAIKARSRAMWSEGDYAPLARRLEPAAEALVAFAGVDGSTSVLDVAAGTGNVAYAAARAGARRVVASDLTPALMELGRAREGEEGTALEWVEADAEALPFDAGSFDRVLSCFGAMFAPRPELVAGELVRVTAPGGTAAMACWTPEGFQAHLWKALEPYAPPPVAELAPPMAWGDADVARSRLLGAGAAAVETEGAVVEWEFTGFDEAWDLLTNAGGGFSALLRSLPDDAARAAAREAISNLALERNTAADGSLRIPGDYLLVRAQAPA